MTLYGQNAVKRMVLHILLVQVNDLLITKKIYCKNWVNDTKEECDTKLYYFRLPLYIQFLGKIIWLMCRAEQEKKTEF